MKKLVNFFIKIFGGLIGWKFGKELIVFIISLCPILEMRGGLLAATLLGVEPLRACIISFIGNILPVPVILLFVTIVLDFMRDCNIKWMNNVSTWVRKKADKHSKPFEKYGYLGLILFVGIPIPGTGAWTGCLIASLMNLNRKKAFLCTFIGLLICSTIMMLISYGILNRLIH